MTDPYKLIEVRCYASTFLSGPQSRKSGHVAYSVYADGATKHCYEYKAFYSVISYCRQRARLNASEVCLNVFDTDSKSADPEPRIVITIAASTGEVESVQFSEKGHIPKSWYAWMSQRNYPVVDEPKHGIVEKLIKYPVRMKPEELRQQAQTALDDLKLPE